MRPNGVTKEAAPAERHPCGLSRAAIVELVRRIAAEKKATHAQVALAWRLARKPWIVPISGTTKVQRLEENLGAMDVELTEDDVRHIDEASSRITVRGTATTRPRKRRSIVETQ